MRLYQQVSCVRPRTDGIRELPIRLSDQHYLLSCEISNKRMSLKRKARKLERTEKNSVTIFETILVTYRMYVVNLIKSKNTEEIMINR